MSGTAPAADGQECGDRESKGGKAHTKVSAHGCVPLTSVPGIPLGSGAFERV